MAGAGVEVGLGVEEALLVRDAIVRRGSWHDLHQAPGTGTGHRLGIIGGFGGHHGLDQGQFDPVPFGGGSDQFLQAGPVRLRLGLSPRVSFGLGFGPSLDFYFSLGLGLGFSHGTGVSLCLSISLVTGPGFLSGLG